MTLNETIMQLVMLAEHPAMPKGFQPTLDKIIEALSELEPGRKNGKWIGKEQFANSPEFYSWQCSVCGCVLEDPTLGKPYPFCPNCGSFNGGEQE